ncbi:MAG: hypothetical protein QOJ25_1024, partial [Solirubrobacteraceae bacterium]|nr:hypothetical protein [Solirubrobacteraceae bacterium]
MTADRPVTAGPLPAGSRTADP